MFFFLSPVSHAALKLIDGFISGERPEDKRIIQIKFYFPMKWRKFWVRGWINEMEKGTTKESSIMAEISPHQEKKCVAGWSWSLSSYINRIYQCKQNGTSIKCDLLEMCERIKPLHQLFVINV